MGNSPSTSKPTTPSSSTHESPKLPKREPKSIIGPGQHLVAIPPEQSMEHATGSNTVNPQSQSRSAPTFPSAAGSGSGPSGDSTGLDSPSRTNSGSSSSHPEPSKPVAVPISHTEPSSLRSHHSDYIGGGGTGGGDGAGPVGAGATGGGGEAPIQNNGSVQDMSYLTRPPRLPLPIEEEIHAPGSPIIAPMGTGEPLEGLDTLDGVSDPDIARNTSVLSASTLEDEDEEELRVEKHRPMVPTRIEWARGGERVYLTGTIFNWNRKTRLHPVDGKPGVYAAVISILPGTHHLRFLVDNVMTTSPDLPTTVDFGNNLVNYIEVSADDLANATASAVSARREGGDPKPGQEEEALRRRRQAPSMEAYAKDLSQYLLDYDQTEENQDYVDGVAAVDKLPAPPGLPGFLTKPILNHQSMVKDDNSVLTLPNHTVLNHLATSSIKHNILAVSATTRYRNKYVTTIIYKPALEDA